MDKNRLKRKKLFDVPALVRQLVSQLKEKCVLAFRDGDTLLTDLPEELMPRDWTQTTLKLAGNQKYMLLRQEFILRAQTLYLCKQVFLYFFGQFPGPASTATTTALDLETLCLSPR